MQRTSYARIPVASTPRIAKRARTSVYGQHRPWLDSKVRRPDMARAVRVARTPGRLPVDVLHGRLDDALARRDRA